MPKLVSSRRAFSELPCPVSESVHKTFVARVDPGEPPLTAQAVEQRLLVWLIREYRGADPGTMVKALEGSARYYCVKESYQSEP